MNPRQKFAVNRVVQIISVIAAAVSIAADSHASPITFESLTPMSTFLRADISTSLPTPDTALGPDIILLSSLGIVPGDTITLSAQGAICFNVACTPDTNPTFDGAFSTSDVLLAASNLDRIPGIIGGSGPPAGATAVYTGLTYDGLTTDIAQDFSIPPPFNVSSPASTSIVVPDGAVYLFLGISDSLYSDNSYAPTQDTAPLGVNLTFTDPPPVPEPGTIGLALAGLAVVAALARKRSVRR